MAMTVNNGPQDVDDCTHKEDEQAHGVSLHEFFTTQALPL
jgi:hypothetical protein